MVVRNVWNFHFWLYVLVKSVLISPFSFKGFHELNITKCEKLPYTTNTLKLIWSRLLCISSHFVQFEAGTKINKIHCLQIAKKNVLWELSGCSWVMNKPAKIQLCSTQNFNLFWFAAGLFTNKLVCCFVSVWVLTKS